MKNRMKQIEKAINMVYCFIRNKYAAIRQRNKHLEWTKPVYDLKGIKPFVAVTPFAYSGTVAL